MKSKRSPFFAVSRANLVSLASAASLLAASSPYAAADTYQWDGNGNITGFSGNGDGSFTGSNWDLIGGTDDGTVAPGAYAIDSDDIAQLGGVTTTLGGVNGAVTLNTNLSIGNLTFQQGGGSFEITGSGSITLNNTAGVSFVNSGGSKTLTLGVDVTNNGTLFIRGGSSTLTLNTGADWIQNGNMNIQSQSATSATLNVNSGATFTFAKTDATQINLSSGGSGNNGSGTLNLNGGTIITGIKFNNAGSGGTGSANLNFSNGGTLKLSANILVLATSGATPTPFNVTVGTGGGIINTNGFSTEITQGITGAGSLTKQGDGTLTLSGTNSYTGKTTLSGGSLVLGTGGSLNGTSEIALNGGNFNVSAVGGYTVGSGKSLTGSGSVTGDVTVNGTLAIGNSPGTITFDNNLTIGGNSAVSNFQIESDAYEVGTFDLAKGGAGDQTVNFDGTLNLFFTNTETFANNSTVQIFDFDLYTGSFDQVIVTGLGAGQTATFDAATGFVTVIPEPAAALLGSLGALALLRRRRH